MKRARHWFATVLAFSLLVSVDAAEDRDGLAEARVVVESLEATIVDVMKAGPALGFEGRFQQLMPVLRRSFDLAYISELVLRRHWESLSEDERGQFTEKFSELTGAIYAGELGDYSGQVFAVVNTKPLRRGRMLVRSELRDGGDVDQFDYVLHQDKAESWRIVNVSVNGVSDLALKRSEYSGVVSQSGLTALLERLDEKINNYRTPK
ncbi:MAG: ABC transporter substrate-binding protein [Pseudomonadota bacterium]